MSRVFQREPLEPLATFWRIYRCDGVALAFTGHDRDLWIDGLLHRSAPGMLPAAIRKSADLSPDSAEIDGALSHDAISAEALAEGRFDNARVAVGVLDWETGEEQVLYHGTIGAVAREGAGFNAQILSAKHALAADPIPRTSPTCRAAFCGPGCTLSATRFTHDAYVTAVDREGGTVTFNTAIPASSFIGGHLRWIDGPHAGLAMNLTGVSEDALHIDADLSETLAPGHHALLREGCDHTLETCAARFGNAVNFRGEPFLPGNDLVARRPGPIA